MDRRIKIDLTVVEACNLEDMLMEVMDAMGTHAEERGYYTTYEKRFMELCEVIAIQTMIEDDEREYTDFCNMADDKQYQDLN
jgi:hypothetical protein